MRLHTCTIQTNIKDNFSFQIDMHNTNFHFPFTHATIKDINDSKAKRFNRIAKILDYILPKLKAILSKG